MIFTLQGAEGRRWDPDSHHGEDALSKSSLRRRDLWFFLGILAFVVLLYFVWQQNRTLRLADEVARLEVRRQALQARILERSVEVTRMRQPDWLMGDVALAEGETGGLRRRVFVQASRRARPERDTASDTWLASIGFDVPQALAAADGP